PSDFAARCHRLETGMAIDLSRLLSDWLAMGYEMESAVEVPGTFARRGGIIDLYPVASPHPVRIELLGSRIDSLRSFDPSSQRSLEPVPSVAIMPARELLCPPQSEERPRGTLAGLDLSRLRPELRERFEEDMARLGEGHWFQGMEFYAPLFHTGCLLDYLPQQALVILDEPGEIEASLGELDEQGRGLREQQLAEGVLPPDFPAPYFPWPELEAKVGAVGRRLSLEQWGADEGDNELPLTPAPGYGGQWPLLLKDIRQWLGEKARVLVVSQQAERVSELLEDEDIIAPALSQMGEPPPPGSLTVLHGSLAQGWVMSQPQVALLSDAEVFGFVKERRWLRRRPVRHQVFLADLSPGDYVVHIDHGIARFAGTTTQGLNGEEREYLVLEYAAGDKLYVPSDQIDRVSRYIGAGGQPPALSRLGTQEWHRTKQRVRQAVGDIARELLELYAAREVAPGFAFSLDTPWQGEMEMSFPYVETPDQQEAVVAVKEDMERPRPMDRLVCGDVGYGKTEVALRAAFKTVMDSKQVAMLVPTTVLAQQHFATFKQRLAPFPLRVEMLSRFRTPKEQHEVIEGLSQGTVDICIGTHRLLQRDVAFRDLGLVIIDEEQRFGVVHKERLKQMRKEVDVLTLSATPIPRTLHMSLAGVRDMSTIETPPEERLPIKTYVAEDSDRLVREAILRELERDGQVFFVHNRVETIAPVARRLMALVPEALVAVGHGQMPEEELEAVMTDFSGGRFDVLVCTTIIESGLDMPNVNTLVVNEADRLGLTQLYQLRGRVGRGGQRAYAYFLRHGGKHLTPTAHQRLETILEATDLGAGFRIAMKDLEIRGGGTFWAG
ncbi:MAG: transcription-repair coupling factor, partial [Dehalococcoidia bacterium]